MQRGAYTFESHEVGVKAVLVRKEGHTWWNARNGAFLDRIEIVDYGVNLVSTLENGSYKLMSTVSVPITTLCPCSKAISDRGAHNQRGCVKFSVVASSAIWLEDMIALVESSASSELYSVLKRPDEKLVTERAYDNPVFVEDLVRNVAIKANQLDSIIWYKIEAENFESIHNHNAYAVVIKNRKN